jgi:hypothetical protein
MSSQKEQFKNNQVLLWGLKQANEDLLKEYDKGNKNPNSISKKKTKKSKNESESETDEEIEESKASKVKKSSKSKKAEEIPKVEKKIVRKFNVDDEYTYKDLDFLNKEYERIEELFGNVSPDEEEELMDLQDKLYNLIEGLTAMKDLTEKMGGQGVYEDETDIDSDLDDEPDFNDKQKKVRKMTGGEIKKPKLQQEKINKQTTKSRVEKGSEQALSVGQKLAEARRKKKDALEQTEEYKKKKEVEEVERKAKEEEAYKKLKPWFYLGDIPKGYREATQEEAIQFRKVSEYGKYKVDSTMYEIFENYNILLSYNLTKFQVNLYLNLSRKKAIKALEDIEINRDRTDSKYTEAQKEKYNSKLELAKHDYKMMNKAYNWLLKEYVPNYKKVNIQLPPKPEIKLSRNEVEFVPKPKVVIDERTGKPVVYKDGIEVIEPEEPELLYFYRGSEELKLKKKFFDDNKHLKSKYADKLYKKNILLPSKYYNKEDAKKYFFNPKETLGGAIIPSFVKRFIPVDVDYKSTKFTRKVQAIIDEVGNEQIKSIVIERTPVSETIKTAINVISQGEFNKQLKDKNYDELFHLRLIIHTDKNKFSIEKNENINMDMNPSMTSNGESKTIFINKHITLNEMIKNAVDKVGEKLFYTYNGVSNNCQDFCLVLLKSSNIGSSDDYIFIKQNTADLFVNMRATGKLMKNITDTYGKLRGFLGGDIYN